MKLYRVRGRSMFPVLREGDFVLVKKLSPKRMKRGRIVVFTREPGVRIVHRIAKIGRSGSVLVKGEGNGHVPEAIDVSAIEGRVVGVIRHGKFFPLNGITLWQSWLLSRVRNRAAWARKTLKSIVSGLSAFGTGRPALRRFWLKIRADQFRTSWRKGRELKGRSRW